MAEQSGMEFTEVLTFFGFDQSMFDIYADIQKHNSIIDDKRKFRRLDEKDFESWLDPKWEFREDLLKLYDRIAIDEVRVNLITYAALYHFGGWYLHPSVYLRKVIGDLDEHSNIVVFGAEDHQASQLAFKFTPKHPLLRDVLNAVVANSKNKIHRHNVNWFSGEALLTAICSRTYEDSVSKLGFDTLINGADSVFETYKTDKELEWPILQLFGIEIGVEPDFEEMPKRITYGQADYILAHAKRYKLDDSLRALRKVRPVYFSDIRQFDKAAPK